ncbi:alpha-like surface protein [Streptococcus agalactiae]|uniref:alpha-like surface protein n=22 Tax=Streptococcus agalactiae TaxID=1311 RepID=UPI000B49E296|nr:YSIRK signal domain/LPXTG anchor domain surface protein [Streptococcus agalactiae]
MFRRSKNNSYDTSQTKQRFSIKKFKFGAASVLIGLSFLGGVTQGNLNIFEESIVAASTIPGSAATLNTSITKNIQNGNAYIDLYDVKNGLIDPQNLIVLNPSSYSANYYIKQGAKYYSNPSEITTTGSATITFNILDETGNPHKKADGQIDIVSVNLTIYDSTALRNRIDEVINNANDPKWSDGSRDEVLTGLEKIKKDIDNNPKTQIDIDNKINEVNEIEKLLVVSLPDKIKYSPEAKHRTVEQHAELDAKDSIANTDELPSNSTYNWKNGHKPDTSTSGEKDGIVEVHYPDGTVDDVNVKVTVTSKKTDNTAPTLTVTPEQQTVKVDEDITFTVTAEDENEVELGLDDLKAKYENDIIGARVKIKYLTKEPNKKVMEVTIMKATLADKGAITFTAKDKAGNQAEPKTVTINVLPPDKIKYSPEAKHRTVEQHAELDAKDSIANTDELPSNSTYNWKNGHKPDTSTPGEKNAVVVVTYPDKSTDEVPVKVTVVDPRTDAEKNDPAGKDQTVKVGEQPDPTKSLEAVPAGSTVAYKEPVDTKTPGEKNAIVVVTYPDKSTDEVPVKVTVVDPRTDAEKNDPAGKDQTVKVGEQPDPTKSLEAVPAGSTVAYKEPVDTKTPGEKNAIVVVTYPDKSTDEVPVKVTVVDPRTDAEKNDPAGKDQTVKVGEQPDPTKSLEAVPAGSTVAYKEPVDTKTPGEKNAVVVVTYPDKSTDEVPVKVTVVDPRTDAEKNDPSGKDQTVKVGEQPDPTKSLEAVPAGSTVAYKEPVDTKTPGEKNAIVVVTYPDKSTDEVPVKVTVVDPRTDAEKNDPAGKDQTVKVGEQPDPTKSLEAVPAGSTVAYKEPVDTKTPGEKNAVVVVTYPDKSTDEVPVKVTVVDPRTDAEKNDPAGKDQTVKVGEQPDPTKSLEAVPAGSTVAYKEPVDTKTPGEKNAIVVVTYPDKSTDEVPVKVTVVDPRTDAEKNDPAGKDQTVKVGEQPDPTKSLEAVPAGSTVAYKEPVDTKTPGEKNAVVVVTYPDKSTDEVPVKVTVVDPRTDAEKNDPAGKDQTVKVGEQPDPTKSLEAVPAGSTVAYKEPVDTKTPGEKNAVVVVTYPDKSTDEVPVKVTVVDPRTDAEKNDPAGGETTVPQGTPISDEEITGLVKIPEGSNGVPKVVGDRPNTDVPGDYKVTVEVTYPDGTKDTVAVTVHVTPKPVPDKDKYDPTGKSQQVNGKGNKLPATGESATPFFNVAALTIISSVGLLSVSKKKED